MIVYCYMMITICYYEKANNHSSDVENMAVTSVSLDTIKYFVILSDEIGEYFDTEINHIQKQFDKGNTRLLFIKNNEGEFISSDSDDTTYQNLDELLKLHGISRSYMMIECDSVQKAMISLDSLNKYDDDNLPISVLNKIQIIENNILVYHMSDDQKSPRS